MTDPDAQNTTIPVSKWIFTWAHLQRLQNSDRNIVLAGDSASSWVPGKLGDNIIGTINYVLNPANALDGKALSTAVSIYDFYHGHIVLPKGEQIPDSLQAEIKGFSLGYRDKILAIHPVAFQNQFPFGEGPSAAQRRAIRQVDEAIAQPLKSLLRRITGELPNLCITYHTYEHNKTDNGIRADWKGRNLMVPFSGSRCPRTLKDAYLKDPVKTATIASKKTVLLSGSSTATAAPTVGATDVYPLVLNFHFLVNTFGKLFVRAGSISLLGLESPS